MGLPWRQVTNAGTAAAGAQTPYAVDWMQSPMNLGWSVEYGASATGTFKLQQTFDDLQSTSPTWVDVTTSGTAAANGTITEPITGLRINFSAGPATAAITFVAIQGMTSR
jgi:hypothetical protein